MDEIEKTPQNETENPVGKPYSKPVLEVLGDLRTLTLGGSPVDFGDQSGDFNTAPFI